MGTFIPKLIWYLYRYLWPFNIDVLRVEGSPNCCEQEVGQRGRRRWKEEETESSQHPPPHEESSTEIDWKEGREVRLMKGSSSSMVDGLNSGREIALDFMELPSKKKWAVYYKIIKRPICIEDIFVRLTIRSASKR